MVDFVAVALRGFGFVASLQAAGIALFLSLFGEELKRTAERLRSLGRVSAFLGSALVLAHRLIEPARLTGDLRGVFDPSMHALLLASDAGAAAAVRLLGLGLVAFGGSRSGSPASVSAVVGATLVAVSFAFMGHTAAAEVRWLLGPLLVVHLLVAAFWFGALPPLYVASKHEDLRTTASVIERFSRLAVRVVPIIAAAGAALAVALLPTLSALQTPYGALLLAKLGAFALLMLLASTNKWRLGPRVAAGRQGALTAFRISVTVEWIILAGVLVATAAMTALFSPE